MTELIGSVIISDDASCAISEMKGTVATRNISGSTCWASPDEFLEINGFSESNAAHIPIHLHGRQEEISKIKKCFKDVATSSTAQLVLVGGESGSGKSTLVEHMRDFVTSPECRGFFCQGKFDQTLLNGGTNEPFSAIATAFSDVIDFILNERDILPERSRAVSDALGSDASTLVDLVPNLSLLLQEVAQNEISRSRSSGRQDQLGVSTKTYTHLAILFRNFLRSLTSEESPILLFLDDLQFADEDSLDVFRALVTDLSLKHVLIVGSYRSNETSPTQLLHPRDALKHTSSTLTTTTIHVGGLNISAINSLLAEKLCLDEEKTEPLSRVVLQKSGGNPFYVAQYLTVLRQMQLLAYHSSEKRWTWNIDEILLRTNVSNNVLELVSQRLKELSDETLALLAVISFIACKFEIELVEMILRQLAGRSYSASFMNENEWVVGNALSLLGDTKSPKQNFKSIEEVVQNAVTDGLIEKGSGITFKFTHDRIQQALYEMIKSESSRSELHYHIGHAMSSLEFGSVAKKRAMLFFVADQLNRGIPHIAEEAELIELAETNLKVGKEAASRAAYQSAATYLRSGLNLLEGAEFWSTHYSLMLDLCSSTAEIEAKILDFKQSRERCELVLRRALSLDDKVRAYVCLVSSYCIQESLDDAVGVGSEYLAQVGVNLPKHPNVGHVMVNLIKTKKSMYKVTDSMILESPMMSDKRMEKAIEVLNTLAFAFYVMANTGEMFAMIVMRMVQLTRRFGVADTSAKSFAFYGMLCSALGNRKQALRYGNLALALMQSPRHENNHVEASVLGLVNHFVMCWEIPLQECASPFLRGANVGKRQGDLEWAYISGTGAVATMFHSGYHLRQTLQVARVLCNEMIDYEVHSIAHIGMPYWQIVENLTGEGDNTYKLSGVAMDEEGMLQTAVQNKNLLSLAIINAIRLSAAVIFQQWELASEIAPLVVKGLKFLDPHFMGFTVRLYLGLAYSESYLSYGKREDLRLLLKMTRKLRQWEHSGVENCRPLHLMLRAESAAAATKAGSAAQKEATLGMCEAAIEQCLVQSLVHCGAMASERASRICLLHGERHRAAGFLASAEASYREWGADAKVEQMEEMYSKLLACNRERGLVEQMGGLY